MVVEIEIPESVVTFIMRLNTDYKGYQEIIKYILTHPKLTISEKQFNDYQKQYLNAAYAFELAKQEIEKKYIDDLYPDKISWTLNYKNNILEVKIKDENS